MPQIHTDFFRRPACHRKIIASVYRLNYFFLLSIYSLLLTQYSFAQTDSSNKPKRKLTFYGTWGYNRFAFTKSTIHFVNKGTPGDPNPANGAYDFTIYDVKASDSPDFNKIKDVANITVPQFSFRAGIYFNNNRDEGFEINHDHSKYVVDDQKVRIKGTISGQMQDKDTNLALPYFHFEHTDGANFWMANYIKRWKIVTSKNGNNSIGWVIKPGLGIVVPRTDVTIFSNRLNNQWHVAGFIVGLETGIRATVFKHICIEFTGKAAYADYLWVFVQYKGNGNANHKFGTVGAILSVGYQFDAFSCKK